MRGDEGGNESKVVKYKAIKVPTEAYANIYESLDLLAREGINSLPPGLREQIDLETWRFTLGQGVDLGAKAIIYLLTFKKQTKRT